ncbi:RING-type domain-containing protein [Psidium guajava]|nr:RING-type domain-containing protein [Psidium guajava]
MAGDGKSKTICSICFEDLKPIIEDLQAIPICGHVFHELCLQQWFEYCPSTRKRSCPICKQACQANKVCRLYFQSVGDVSDAALPPKSPNLEVDPGVLRVEVRRLEGKVSGLISALEQQTKDLDQLNEELCLSKELSKKEAALKDDVLKQKASIQQLLHLKSQELDKTTLECLRLQERNMALAKELAALKLVSDLDLEEGEVLKLASLGNEGNTRDTIDILRKSLVIRNQSYKELMAKCNVLGRGEARSTRKLEKARGKISKLKIRIQELEASIEATDNEVLRSLKQKKQTPDVTNQSGATCYTTSAVGKSSPEDESAPPPEQSPDSNLFGKLTESDAFLEKEGFRTKRNVGANNNNGSSSITSRQVDSFIFIKEDASELPLPGAKNVALKKEVSKSENSSNFNQEAVAPKASNIPVEISASKTNTNAEYQKETPPQLPLGRPGEICFSGGLLGPDGTTRYLGKWCKRGHSGTLKAAQGSSINNGGLIAVGSDGRGGRIKALRSSIQTSLDGKETPMKRCKSESKTNISHSKKCSQIEHFFAKMSH